MIHHVYGSDSSLGPDTSRAALGTTNVLLAKTLLRSINPTHPVLRQGLQEVIITLELKGSREAFAVKPNKKGAEKYT